MLSEAIAVTLIVTDVLEALGVPYAIGGSLASAVHGVARTIRDANIIANLRMEYITPQRELIEAGHAGFPAK
ncbi:MAG TPA: hypothetical protein VER55_09515 [Ardenticatenaceae bacterium]|nr:hypothetical protein [Ardenticatenaceae bacterium]